MQEVYQRLPSPKASNDGVQTDWSTCDFDSLDPSHYDSIHDLDKETISNYEECAWNYWRFFYVVDLNHDGIFDTCEEALYEMGYYSVAQEDAERYADYVGNNEWQWYNLYCQ